MEQRTVTRCDTVFSKCGVLHFSISLSHGYFHMPTLPSVLEQEERIWSSLVGIDSNGRMKRWVRRESRTILQRIFFIIRQVQCNLGCLETRNFWGFGIWVHSLWISLLKILRAMFYIWLCEIWSLAFIWSDWHSFEVTGIHMSSCILWYFCDNKIRCRNILHYAFNILYGN